MDESLKDPAARDEIAHKIEETEFAQNLIQKIRDVTHRLRLGTPKVIGRGLGNDPNSVAEYLDNVMSADQVQEFDKLSLQSDVHLAEVAACHQVLALVTSQAAVVEPQSRLKMYALAQRSHEQHEYHAAAANGAGHAAATAVLETSAAMHGGVVETAAAAKRAMTDDHLADHHHNRPTVPEYLREPRHSRFWPIAATLLIAAAGLLGVARIFGPLDQSHPLLATLGMAAAKDPDSKTIEKNVNNQNTSAIPNGANVTIPSTALTPAGVNPENAAVMAIPVNPAPANSNDATKSAVNPAVPVTIDPATGKVVEAVPALTQPAAPGKTISPEGAVVPAPNEVALNNGKTPPPPPLPDGAVPPVVIDPAAPPAAVPAFAAAPVGRLNQDPAQVILRRLPQQDEVKWERLLGGETITNGQHLLSLHTYRPMLTLSNGVNLVLVGETRVELRATATPEIPQVIVHFGRVVLLNNGAADKRIQLQPGLAQPGLLVLDDPDSEVAVEVRRYLPLGSDPETAAAPLAIVLYGSKGRFQWQGPGVAALPEPVVSPSRLPLPANPLEPAAVNSVMQELPKWIAKSDLTGSDQTATLPFSLQFDPRRPVNLALRELATNRRSEIRYMAARSLALIDDFEPFIASFSDPDQKGVWTKEIEALQAALTRGPDTAALVRETFEKLRREDGDKLYRYVRGLSKADMANGGGEELLDALESESLDMRVLGFQALRDAFRDPKTGASPTFNYTPDTTASSRQGAVTRWRSHWKEQAKRFAPE